MQDKILAIIPARSGSKGLKDKNIKNLNGKPMINYTIETALESKIFSNIIVSTDSEKYAEISEKAGAEVPFIRPQRLATDESATSDVVLHAIDKMQQKNGEYNYFMLLQPTSPLRTVENIKGAYSLLKEKDANSIVGVCKTDHNPLWSNTLDESLSMDNFLNHKENIRRQDLPTYYRLNGAIYLAEVDYYKKYNDFYFNNSYAYIMSKRESIDVDDIIDFKLASLILNKIRK
ncbi:cytidylyltransferase domain-containing protein [Halanaerobium praevalens]|uniref:Acylneuraminate cytidylyltransferase n=1 Tax=Halanaerobium praevalens (strain ATCC 33744 / DSM 2228 / GSL) TaxID=572479 RepID=E3DNE7_HALPG|nr:acylneuraminate cytidylyltransferase family protein [Halanaerobium praevalens]ADO76485.1 acylneuraminate cytidylyltransferase [Halanaerobium praevalens DSM 2228]